MARNSDDRTSQGRNVRQGCVDGKAGPRGHERRARTRSKKKMADWWGSPRQAAPPWILSQGDKNEGASWYRDIATPQRLHRPLPATVGISLHPRGATPTRVLPPVPPHSSLLRFPIACCGLHLFVSICHHPRIRPHVALGVLSFFLPSSTAHLGRVRRSNRILPDGVSHPCSARWVAPPARRDGNDHLAKGCQIRLQLYILTH